MTAPVTPFSIALAEFNDTLPEPLRRQFVEAPGASGFRLRGHMLHVWHRPFWLTPLLWMSAQMNMLFPETGRDIPVSLRVRQTMEHGKPVQVWKRAFNFNGRKRSFNAFLSCEDDGRIIERMGPMGVFELEWAVAFRAPDTVTIDGNRLWVRMLSQKVRLPSVLFGRIIASQTAKSHNEVRLRLLIRHPVLGDVFGYEGQLTVESNDR